jgi:prepilin-type N-terminal cleavage/methylation domain-containing protein
MFARIRQARGGDGFTLVEVLVAMTMLSVVIALSTGLIIRALDQNSNVGQQAQAQQRNNTGMEQITRALRQAVYPTNGTNKNASIITLANPTQIQFTTRLQSTASAQNSTNCNAVTGACTWGTAPVQVQASLNTTTHNFNWGTGAPTLPCATPCAYATPSLTRTLVYGVRNNQGSSVCPKNTGDGAIFHYWYIDPTGNMAAWSPAVAGSPTQAELAKISVVQINFWTQTQTGPQKPGCVALSDYVQLRNWS